MEAAGGEGGDHLVVVPWSADVPTEYGHWKGEGQNDKTGCSHKDLFEKREHDMRKDSFM